eukprot:3415863-Karenia_brevis.AAC.1
MAVQKLITSRSKLLMSRAAFTQGPPKQSQQQFPRCLTAQRWAQKALLHPRAPFPGLAAGEQAALALPCAPDHLP